ncbi:MAG: hypothetical protein Q7J84_03950 [Sulfuricaulis sp.]|nr:hypothetical protein [Sulfuricaulis sp.]
MLNEHIGKTFRQLSYKLRIQRGPGNPDKVSERPRDSSKRYLDGDNPTLIVFEAGDQVDVDSLLSLGAIVPWHTPTKAIKEAHDGKAG